MSKETRGPKTKLDPLKYGVWVYCGTCGMPKAPMGRSIPVPLVTSMCDYRCRGYRQEPRVGSLWSNESEEDFGYPVGEVGTRRIHDETTDQKLAED